MARSKKQLATKIRDEFFVRLVAGDTETVTLVTHPFLRSDNMDVCDRCGVIPEDPDTMLTYRSCAWRHEGEKPRVSPVIVKECPDCIQVEGRFDGAQYAAA